MNTKNFNYNGFLLIAQSTQKDLLAYTSYVVKKIYGDEDCICNNDFVYAHGSKIMLVAHLDTVHKEKPDFVLFDKAKGIIWSREGIGGDDRCGVFSILYIIKYCKLNNIALPSILFTTNEEIGCLGAEKAANELKDIVDLNYIIEIDRKGKDDMVFYDCQNNDFHKYIGSFGFKKQFGSSSDIRRLCPKWNVAGVNLSHGVYECHTTEEYVVVDEMFDTINKIIKMLEDNVNKKFLYKIEYDKKKIGIFTRKSKKW